MQQKCPRCLYPENHPFGLNIFEMECSGCLTHKEKNEIDWSFKKNQLVNIFKKYRKQYSGYDCVVPVIGDAEDYFTLSTVLAHGMSPLVVCVNDYFKNDIGWYNLHNLITHFDVDSLVFNPDIRVYKELIRTSLRKYNHILLPFLQLHTSFPVHVARERKIPLIVWGQNQAIEQAGKFSHQDSVEMSRWSRQEHDLFGCEIDKLTGNGAQIDERYLNYYHYPNVHELFFSGVRGIYLSNYIRWDPLAQNAAMINFGFRPEDNNATFDVYERAGSSVYYNIHDLLKLKNHGFRKVSDHIAREIRHGRLTTSQGRELKTKYQSNKVVVRPFFDWLGVTKTGYEWFKQHKLHDYSFLISESSDFHSPKISVPDVIKNKVLVKENFRRKFVSFGKGISVQTERDD